MQYLKLDTNILPIKARSIEEFNEYVDKYKTDSEIILTKNNNISQKTLRQLPASKTWKRGNTMEFQYIDGSSQIRVIYAIHYDEKSEKNIRISTNALNYFKGIMEVIPTDDKEEDIEMFVCEENKDSAYYNYVNERYIGFTINDTYSLDRNNSFPASMVEIYPQTKPWIDKYYEERKLATKSDEMRLYGSILIGWLNNPRYKRHIAWKKIVSNSNEKVHNLRKQLEAQGHEILIVNTDAVKFIGKADYIESNSLGEFKYEWESEKMYIRGIKSYAVTKDNKWTFKLAGKTNLDKVKPREQWTIEDFINREEIKTLRIVIRNNRLEHIEDETY